MDPGCSAQTFLDVNLFQILNFSCTPLANQTKQKSPPNSKPAKDINLW